MKKKIVVLVVSIALLAGVLSGCLEEEEEPAANNAPEVTFAYTVDHNTSMDGGTVDFDSTASDADNDDLTYLWDFGDDETSTDADPQHMYATNGSYTVMVTVNDSTDETTSSATVIVGNIGPTALFVWSAVNLTTTFTDASVDPNDDDLTYTWDFDSDDVEDNTTAGPIEFTYIAAGSYNATLTVTDPWGLSDSYTEEITVED